MVPGCRAGSGCGSLDTVTGIQSHGRRSYFMGIAMILAVIVIAPRHGSVLAAPQGNFTPERIRDQTPCAAVGLFVPARCQSIVKIDRCFRILERQTVRTVIHDNAEIFSNVHGFLDSIYNGSGMNHIRAAGKDGIVLLLLPPNHNGRHVHIVHDDSVLSVLLLLPPNHNGRHVHIVHDDSVLSSGQCLDRQFHVIKICHIMPPSVPRVSGSHCPWKTLLPRAL